MKFHRAGLPKSNFALPSPFHSSYLFQLASAPCNSSSLKVCKFFQPNFVFLPPTSSIHPYPQSLQKTQNSPSLSLATMKFHPILTTLLLAPAIFTTALAAPRDVPAAEANPSDPHTSAVFCGRAFTSVAACKKPGDRAEYTVNSWLCNHVCSCNGDDGGSGGMQCEAYGRCDGPTLTSMCQKWGDWSVLSIQTLTFQGGRRLI